VSSSTNQNTPTLVVASISDLILNNNKLEDEKLRFFPKTGFFLLSVM